DHLDTVERLRHDLADLRNVWGFDAGDLAELEAGGAEVEPAEVERRRAALERETLASIVYTSGTTGRPKGCALTHGNCLGVLEAIVPNLPELFDSGGSTLLFLPLAHIFGRAIQIACVSTRTRMGYCGDVKQLVPSLQSFAPTFLLSVPRVFEKVYNTAKQQAHASGKGGFFDAAERTAIAYSEALDRGKPGLSLRARHAVFERLVYSKLRAAVGGEVRWAVSGGGPLGARLGHFFRGAGITVLEVYGLTETLASTFNWPHTLKVGSVGQPVPGSAVRIAHDGEILTRGPGVFGGYWHNEAATEETFADGWFKTGDIGELDADGFLTITGRKKELIVTSSGKNVAPAVLEDRIRAHPLISQCMVVGDNKPFVACLITLDQDAWRSWAPEHGLSGAIADHAASPVLRNDLQSAIDDANKAVSKAESIRKFTVLPQDFTEESGEITPTLKLKRAVVAKNHAEQIDALYAPSA
ncbi:MAG: AMP-dependent synthetase/ligase, partial [Acidimicrobiales bacterium]